MELTYDNVIKWFDDYFDAFNVNEGDPDRAQRMREYFVPDLELVTAQSARGVGSLQITDLTAFDWC